MKILEDGIREGKELAGVIDEANQFLDEYLTSKEKIQHLLTGLLTERKNGKLTEEQYKNILSIIFEILRQKKLFVQGMDYMMNKNLSS
jgi:hypothetical protein